MPPQPPSLARRSVVAGRAVGLLMVVLSGLLPLSARADLFYRVQKVVRQSDLDPTADQGIPMVVTGLNDSGCMVGFFTDSVTKVHGQSQTILHAFVWDDAAQTLTDLNDDLGSSSMALCVNNAGVVAGVYWTPGTAAQQNGFVWQAGAATSFQSPQSGSIDAVTGLDAYGDVIGTYYGGDYGNKRAFVWDGTTCTDLGDLGDPANSFVWPQFINDAGQVVGTVYVRSGRGVQIPDAFLWQAGSMSELAGLSDLGPSTAQMVNDAGQIVGSYFTVGQIAGQLGPVAGYFWANGAATDLGDLGGGGTVPFAIDANGNVYGTTYDADGVLHLFSWNDGTLSDVALANLLTTDLDFQTTGFNAAGSLTGFVHDADGNIQATVCVGGVQYRLTDLLPAYLAFTKMSSAYGSQVLINGVGQIACAGTDSGGSQMALLLSVDPDTDNDGLPDSWEMQYYGHLGVGKDDQEAGGGGLTNWEAYQQGSDPNDFYNGNLPNLFVSGGGNQRGVAGSMLPQPISVEVDCGDRGQNQNAPVVFTVTGGALLAPDASGSTQPTNSLAVRADNLMTYAGTSIYVAQAYVYLPNTIGAVSTVTATATSGTRSTAASTTATTTDPNVQPPTDLSLVSNTSNSALLSFTPSDTTLPVSLEISQDQGATWALWATAQPGASTCTLAALPADQLLFVRAYTGIDQGGGQTSQTNQTGQPSGTSVPTDSQGLTAYSRTHLICEAENFPLSTPYYNWSYKGFQGNTRYLKSTAAFVLTPSDPSAPSVSSTREYVYDGLHLDSDVETSSGAYMNYQVLIQLIADSDTTAHADNTVSEGDLKTSFTLSEPYSADAFKAAAEGEWQGFKDTLPGVVQWPYCEKYRDEALLDLETGLQGDTQEQGTYVSGYTDGYDASYLITRMQYVFQVNKDANGRVCYDTVFEPKDGSAIVHAVQTWDTQGDTQSPAMTLDPVKLNDKAEGVYQVLVPVLHAYGHADFPWDEGDLTYDGDMVPSNQIGKTAHPEKHFVVPKAAGGYVTFDVLLSGTWADPKLSFGDLYKIVVLLNGADVTNSVVPPYSVPLYGVPRFYLKTDTANKYVVQIQTNDGKATVVDSLNVWVVSATLKGNISSTATSAIDGSPLGVHSGHGTLKAPDGTVLGPGYLPYGGIDWVAVIQPPNIITDSDRPALEKQTRVSPPGNDKGVAGPSNPDASGSGFSGWDISRQRQTNVNYGASLTPTTPSTVQPYPSVSFPTSDTEGNDDGSVYDEDSDPYTAGKGSIGQLILSFTFVVQH